MIPLLIASSLLLLLVLVKIRQQDLQTKAMWTALAQIINTSNESVKNVDFRLDRCENNIYDLDFQQHLMYFDLVNYLHKSHFLREDMNGDIKPYRYEWSLEEEERLLHLKTVIDKECDRRGLPKRSFSHLQGL